MEKIWFLWKILTAKVICWEMTVKGGKDLWGNILLDMTMEHTMTPRVRKNNRYRNNEELSRLDSLFTSEPEIMDKIYTRHQMERATTYYMRQS